MSILQVNPLIKESISTALRTPTTEEQHRSVLQILRVYETLGDP